MKHVLRSACALALLAAVPVPAADAQPIRTVSYHGYQVTVPASWRVVDLTSNPAACVRLDQPAVYLGHPGDQSGCPANLTGRQAGLLVEPLDQTASQRITSTTAVAADGSAALPAGVPSRNDAIQLAVTDAGVLVTAEHAPGTEQQVRTLLSSARLVPGGSKVELVRPRQTRLAAPIVAPGTVLGQGFDACTAPSQVKMDAWRSSPFKAVGVYISGSVRACAQPNLTPTWVATNSSRGWRFILIDVGRQNPCSGFATKFSTDPATARQQGRDAASASHTAAVNLGFGVGSAIYSDIEGYNSTASCRAATLNYVSGWTQRLRELGFLGGVYSSAGSGMVDLASGYNNTSYTRADHIWFAWWNGAADTNTGSYVPASYWANHQRIHQYRGDHNETHGGQTINIDSNYLDVGTGGTPPPTCASVNRDFTVYTTLRLGATGDQVRAAQCELQEAGHSPGNPDGQFGSGTEQAVRAFQTAVGLTSDGVLGPRTWTALLAHGDTPTLRSGSTGEAVRRLQRSLTAALGRTVGIDGQFGPNTEQAVRDYQTRVGLTADGIVGALTWGALQDGR